MLIEVTAIVIAVAALIWTLFEHFARKAGDDRSMAAAEAANDHALRAAEAAERSAEAAERVAGAEQNRFEETSRARAFEEVLWPLLDALQGAARPLRLAGSGTTGAASTRFRAIEATWREAGRLLGHPLCVHLDEEVLASVAAWHKAENDLQSIWEGGADMGSVANRVSFALLVEDSSRRMNRVTDEEIDSVVWTIFTAPSDGVFEEARETARDDEERFERKRLEAEEWHRVQRQASQARSAAALTLDEAIKLGAQRQSDNRTDS